MSSQHFDEHSVKKYTLTAFLSFVVVFCFLMLMMQCHGPFVPSQGHAETPAKEAAAH